MLNKTQTIVRADGVKADVSIRLYTCRLQRGWDGGYPCKRVMDATHTVYLSGSDVEVGSLAECQKWIDSRQSAEQTKAALISDREYRDARDAAYQAKNYPR